MLDGHMENNDLCPNCGEGYLTVGKFVDPFMDKKFLICPSCMATQRGIVEDL